MAARDGEVALYVPAELRRPAGARGPATPRWFRLAVAICPRHLRLRSAVPEDLAEGPVEVRLHLPLDLDPPPPPIEAVAVAAETVVDEGEERERAELRLLQFRSLSEAQRALIERYVATHAPGAADRA